MVELGRIEDEGQKRHIKIFEVGNTSQHFGNRHVYHTIEFHFKSKGFPWALCFYTFSIVEQHQLFMCHLAIPFSSVCPQ